MIESQLQPNNLTDERIIAAIQKIGREKYVPAALKDAAYIDEDIPVAEGRYLMEPVSFARLVQAAELLETDIVLDIACATGYSSAILGSLCRTVVGVEENQELARQAEQNLITDKIANANIFVSTHASGYAEQAPYNVIFIQGAVEKVPQELFEQLSEAGRLLGIVRNGVVGHAHVYKKINNVITDRILFDVSVPMLPGFESKSKFIF